MTGLERLRLDNLLTPERLGELVHLDGDTIRRIEKGKPARVESLAKLSAFFGVKASALVRPASELPDPPSDGPSDSERVAA